MVALNFSNLYIGGVPPPPIDVLLYSYPLYATQFIWILARYKHNNYGVLNIGFISRYMINIMKNIYYIWKYQFTKYKHPHCEQ